jgi:uncharacterized protein
MVAPWTTAPSVDVSASFPRYGRRMIVDTLKAHITRAVKDKDEAARDVLRLALGEVQTAEARAARALRDEEVVAIVRKLVKSNEETLAALGDDTRAVTLRHEIAALSALLPRSLTVAQILEALQPEAEAIRAAKSDGQATGVAMKHLKSTGAVVDGTDVSTAVRSMRA